ncbi:MAG TPA: type 4a pilus biogenesis protein PilO [Candidatus Xenobia bacterium]|nr:type 4a pilus biogenesis protein PilO [Candidatus Xenobia bacterium]
MSRLYPWRRALYWGLGLVIVANVVVYVGWLRGLAQRIVVDPARVEQLEREVAERTAEVERLKKVRADAPTAAPRLDAFVRERFWGETVGSARLHAELAQTAEKTGVQIGKVNYKPSLLKERPELTELDIHTTVAGSYGDLLRFLEALESSPRFYLIRQLTVGEVRGGQMRLDMTLVTYFRRGTA